MGKLLGLGQLLAERWDLLEADFQRFYTLDLREEIRGPARRLWVLVDGLPADAAVFRNPGVFAAPLELQAQLLERVDEWARTFLHFQAGDKVQALTPVELTRPGAPEEPDQDSRPTKGGITRQASPEELANLMKGGDSS